MTPTICVISYLFGTRGCAYFFSRNTFASSSPVYVPPLFPFPCLQLACQLARSTYHARLMHAVSIFIRCVAAHGWSFSNFFRSRGFPIKTHFSAYPLHEIYSVASHSATVEFALPPTFAICFMLFAFRLFSLLLDTRLMFVELLWLSNRMGRTWKYYLAFYDNSGLLGRRCVWRRFAVTSTPPLDSGVSFLLATLCILKQIKSMKKKE